MWWSIKLAFSSCSDVMVRWWFPGGTVELSALWARTLKPCPSVCARAWRVIYIGLGQILTLFLKYKVELSFLRLFTSWVQILLTEFCRVWIRNSLICVGLSQTNWTTIGFGFKTLRYVTGGVSIRTSLLGYGLRSSSKPDSTSRLCWVAQSKRNFSFWDCFIWTGRKR